MTLVTHLSSVVGYTTKKEKRGGLQGDLIESRFFVFGSDDAV